MMAFGAAMTRAGSGPLDPAIAAPGIAMARCVARDPAAGPAAPALARIDAMLAAAEAFIADPVGEPLAALGLVHASIVIAATERLEPA
jgi:hypothetical protein